MEFSAKFKCVCHRNRPLVSAKHPKSLGRAPVYESPDQELLLKLISGTAHNGVTGIIVDTASGRTKASAVLFGNQAVVQFALQCVPFTWHLAQDPQKL
ncbi:hypothetical protein EK904_004346 [Melospiza melodia maxima]|nr:hypothetical protein EK904_004346 [Melospiza melodia maxima]